jgi:[ribosomal protein S5]-alanine N-acetyltransferase
MADPVLVTERLSLREITWSDLAFLESMLGDPSVMRHYPKPHTRDETAAWLQRNLDRYAKDGHGMWLVSDRASSEPLGQVGLVKQIVEGTEEAEIGYLIHAPFWRHGYAAEAAAAVRDFAFGTLDKSRVISLVRPVNIASQRVALRIGSKPERLVIFHDLEHIVFSQERP